MRPPVHYARSGDLKIAYQVTGSGPVDLVLAPGTVSQLDMEWDWPPRARFLEGFGSFCRLIRFDKRGTGLSDRPDHIATLEERTDDIRAVMDAASSQSAAILGASEGSSMACLFAATQPNRTRALLVWGGQARWVKTDDYPWGVTQEEKDREVAELTEHGVTNEYVFPHGLPSSMDPAYADWFLRWVRAGAGPAAMAALERMNAQIDIRDILPSIRVPTLVMNRTGDPIANIAAARDLAARIPGARLAEFPGETHSMFLIEPEKVLAAIAEFVTGARRRVSSDRVLASILFLDIVGSTERAVELGDASWRELVGRFYAVVESALEANGGVIVDRAGDGVLATVDGPARAIRGARAALADAKTLDLRLRAGVHTGEVERDGATIRGIAVHIASRIASLAEADEILVSGTVRDLVAGSGISFRDRGLHSLKGIPEPRHLYLVGTG